MIKPNKTTKNLVDSHHNLSLLYDTISSVAAAAASQNNSNHHSHNSHNSTSKSVDSPPDHHVTTISTQFSRLKHADLGITMNNLGTVHEHAQNSIVSLLAASQQQQQQQQQNPPTTSASAHNQANISTTHGNSISNHQNQAAIETNHQDHGNDSNTTITPTTSNTNSTSTTVSNPATSNPNQNSSNHENQPQSQSQNSVNIVRANSQTLINQPQQISIPILATGSNGSTILQIQDSSQLSAQIDQDQESSNENQQKFDSQLKLPGFMKQGNIQIIDDRSNGSVLGQPIQQIQGNNNMTMLPTLIPQNSTILQHNFHGHPTISLRMILI